MLAAALLALPSCVGSPDAAPEAGIEPTELPLIGLVLVEYDGHEFHYQDLRDVDPEVASGVGVVAEELVDIPSMGCGSSCTGTGYVGFTNVAGSRVKIVNGASFGADPIWDAAAEPNCGATPTTGICQAVRVRNMFTEQLERVYVRIRSGSLRPTGTTTAVQLPTQPFTGVADFGETVPVPNGFWRYGEIGRATSVENSPSLHWAFTGTTPAGSDFTFVFVAEVRGLVVQPTQRATLAAGLLDRPGAGAYTAQASVAPRTNSHIAISDDGRYAVFASVVGSTGTIYRKDLTTGALDVVVTGCPATSFGNPDVSNDGAIVAFQAQGVSGSGPTCDPAGIGSASGNAQVYAFDFSSSTTTLVSQSTTGGYANGQSSLPRVSGDGTAVVFQSTARNLVSGTPSRGCADVYRRDLAAGTLAHVSARRGSSVTAPTSASWLGCSGTSAHVGSTPDVGVNGNLVAFASVGAIDAADTNALRDIYVYDHAASTAGGTVVSYRVSVTSSGGALDSAAAEYPAMSANEAFVAFRTDATNVAAANAAGASTRTHVYRRSSQEAAHSSILRASQRIDDAEGSANTDGIPALSSSGRFVAFWSAATDLAAVAGRFSPAGSQLYVCDLEAPVAELERCWVASTAQVDASRTSTFVPFGGTAYFSVRVAMAYPDDTAGGAVAYLASSSRWDSALSGAHMFVSPVGDPRYQQPAIAP